MITVSILINGKPIYTRSAVNKGICCDKKTCFYEVDTGETIYHRPDDGVVVLAKKLLETIKEAKE